MSAVTHRPVFAIALYVKLYYWQETDMENTLRLHNIVQCSPKTFPRLQSGKNAVRVSYAFPQASADAILRITHAWEEEKK